MGRIELIVRAVIVRKQQLLLVRQKNRNYSFLPGGHIEFGESAVDALRRELKEETGVIFKIGRFLGAVEHTWRKKAKRHSEINLLFEVGSGKSGITVKSLEPRLEFFWHSMSRLDAAKLQPSILRTVLSSWTKTSISKRWASTY